MIYPDKNIVAAKGAKRKPVRAAILKNPTKHIPVTKSPSISPIAIVVIDNIRGTLHATKWK